jgi:hypothetical protein
VSTVESAPDRSNSWSTTELGGLSFGYDGRGVLVRLAASG